MAIYYSTIIETDILGDTEVKITETSSLNSFLNSLGQEKFIISSLNIWSDNESQLTQPITLIQNKPEGNVNQKLKIPSIDKYQSINILNDVKLGNFQFDEDSKFDYTILANTKIKLTLNMISDEEARKKLSYTKMLEKSGAKNVVKDITEDLGFKEPEELTQWFPEPAKMFKEIEELIPIRKGKVKVKKPKKKKAVKKVALEDYTIPIIVGISLILWYIADNNKYKYLPKNV